MKSLALFALLLLSVSSQRVMAQSSSIASARLKSVHGAMTNFGSVTRNDSLILVCFWAVSEDPSVNELNAINASYDKWKKSVNFRMLAVSTDQGTEANKVRPVANMNEWKFDVFTDIEGDLRTAVHSTSVPQAVIIKSGKVVYLQSGYDPGSEKYLFEKLRSIAAGKS